MQNTTLLHIWNSGGKERQEDYSVATLHMLYLQQIFCCRVMFLRTGPSYLKEVLRQLFPIDFVVLVDTSANF